jgi:hypothetical protein
MVNCLPVNPAILKFETVERNLPSYARKLQYRTKAEIMMDLTTCMAAQNISLADRGLGGLTAYEQGAAAAVRMLYSVCDPLS